MMSHKKIHRFLVEDIPSASIGTTITLNNDRIAKQINRVLKIRPGEEIQVFADSSDTYIGTITHTTDFTVALTITAIIPLVLPTRVVIAAISIVKGDAFEMMVQKLTEIGVNTIVPLISGRTIKQNIRINRLQTISDEAVEQCGATQRVTITEPMTLKECFTAFPFESVVLDPVTTNKTVSKMADKIVCYVGPEGGWDEKDEEIITGFNPTHLQITDRVLRTETAAILGVYSLLWQ
ncbi:MAG: RsmE family RNA methyltransferase [Candidatus Paceibacterota bacterium]